MTRPQRDQTEARQLILARLAASWDCCESADRLLCLDPQGALPGLASVLHDTGLLPVVLESRLHVWWASLDPVEDLSDRLTSLLTPEEQLRASRFVFAADRRRFAVGRGILRALLSSYLGVPPEEVILGYGSWGKPYLQAPVSSRELDFSLSHSAATAIYALTPGLPVGADVELVRQELADSEVARLILSADERLRWHRLPEGERTVALLRCWTRKEAYLKARGDGLRGLPPDRVEVTVPPEAPVRLLRVDGDPAVARGWRLLDVKVPPGHVGAVALACT